VSLQGPPRRRRPRDYPPAQPPRGTWRGIRFRLDPLLVIAAALALIVVVIVLIAMRLLQPAGSAVALPRFAGMSLADAQRTAAGARLSLRVVAHHPHTHAPKDQVIGQFPAPGEYVREGRTVDVIVSDGPMQSSVPNLSGMSLRDAQVALSNAHLEVGNVTEAQSTALASGRILDQRPDAFSQVPEGSKVDVTVARGRAEVYVPNFVGLSLAYSQSAARTVGVALGPPLWLPIAKNARPKGTVIAQDPLPGQPFIAGEKIVLRVSGGPPPTPTPLPTFPPTPAPESPIAPSPTEVPSPEASGTTPTPAPVSRSMRIGVKLPSSATPKRIRVVLVDAAGTRDLYDETTTGGFTLSFDVTVTGNGAVQTYVEGTLVNSTNL
jgi:beta-lactam-binding protein with PASTA domain